MDGVNEVLYDTPKCYVFSANGFCHVLVPDQFLCWINQDIHSLTPNKATEEFRAGETGQRKHTELK